MIEALEADDGRWQQELEERQQTECPRCALRPVSDDPRHYVYVRRGDLYPKEPRCVECFEAAVDVANEKAIRETYDWSKRGGIDLAPDGRPLYIGTQAYEIWVRADKRTQGEK